MRDSDKPAAATCHWFEEADGTRWLIPGCHARLFDPDADCTCATLADRLAVIERERDRDRRTIRSLRRWNDAIRRAVEAHPDARTIMHAAATRTTAADDATE